MRIYNKIKALKSMKILLPSFLKSRFSPVPLWTHIYVTRKCNLNCKYCFVKDQKKTELDGKGLINVIDKLYALGCRFISFFGGEPTIRKDFVDMVEYANRKGMFTHMTTNGILLTPDYINRLGKAGIDIVNLSVDSVFEFDYSNKDYTKSKDVLKDLIAARKKYGFEITVNFVLTRKNVDIVVKTIKLFDSFKIPISIGLIYGSVYSDKEQDKSLFFNTENDRMKLFEVLDEIKQLKKKKCNIIDPLKYFEDMKKFVKGELDWYCCAGEYYFSVDSDGKFQICCLLPDENMSIFDIDKDYFKKISNSRKTRLDKCKKICYCNCLYDTSYFIKHPLSFIKEIF